MHAGDVTVALMPGAAVVGVEASGRGPDDRHWVPDETRTLQLVERAETVPLFMLVHVQDVRPRRPGGNGQV